MAQNEYMDSEQKLEDEIVISGISGIFPSSDSVSEFKENLYDKINMVQRVASSNSLKHPEIPNYMGTVSGMEKFDAQFFAVHNKQAAVMEPMCRKLLEHVYSAIYDAGINPITLKNTRTGVFVATMFCDTENKILYETKRHNNHAVAGCVKSMFSNRISFWLNSNGPSYTMDVGFAGSTACLQQACWSIRAGECEAAIVGATNFHTNPASLLNYKRFGLAGVDAGTKSYERNAEAPARSDAINVLFLQKAKDAKRIYCEVYHIKGEYYVSPDAKFLPIRDTEYLKGFLEQFYLETDVKPEQVEYIEGGFGIKEADIKEMEAVGKVFGRKHVAKLGSVQSNMGNSGPVSGVCSITKLCIAYQNGKIPANLHFTGSNHAPINQGVQVLTENIPFNRGFTALNNISFNGSTYHALFKGHYREKNLSRYQTDVPYLILASGRQQNNVDRIFCLLASEPVDPELIGLLHNIHGSDITGHVYRGYAVLDPTANRHTKPLVQNIQHFSGGTRPIAFVYSGVGSQWSGMGKDLMRLPLFAKSILKCQKILEAEGVDLMNILCNDDANIFEDPVMCFVGITAMQIALTDLLRELGIIPDCFIGHSLGELSCAYADGAFSAEQVLLLAYIRGTLSKTKQIPGAMIAVGLGYNDVKKLCPPGIEVACHNSPQSSTLSGPADDIREFGEELKNLGIFVKEVPCGNIASHSRYIAHNGPKLTELMSKYIKDPKPRSSKWISTSFPEHLWKTEAAKYSSVEYHVQNILKPVLFEEASKHLPVKAIVIEVAPHSLLQGIIRQCRIDSTYVGLTRRDHQNPLVYLMESIGKLYELGLNPKVEVLYPKIEFPVSTNTDFLSHYVGWEHSEDWPLFDYITKNKVVSKSRTVTISVHDDEYKYLQDHVRGGVNVLPEAVFLVLVWETLGIYHNVDYRNMSLVFLEVHFHDELILNNETLKLNIMISKAKHETFEISCEDRLLVSGIIKLRKAKRSKFSSAEQYGDINYESDKTEVESHEIYQMLYHRGFRYGGKFQSIKSTNPSITKADIEFTGDWMILLDALIQMNTLALDYEGVSIPKYIDKLEISVDEDGNIKDDINFYSAERCEVIGVTRCAGIEIRNITFVNKPIFTEEKFVLNVKSIMYNNEANSDNVLIDKINIKLTKDLDEKFDNYFWTEVPLSKTSNTIQVSYAGITFRDVKIPKYNHEHKYLGMDFSGIDSNGTRVMGVVREGAVSNTVESDPVLLWPVPEYWTLEEAATVPLPFLHAYYCLAIKYSLHRRKTIFITSGSGGFGQAVIALSLALDCTVFTTVGNLAKKRYLLQLFPRLDERNISLSEEDAYFMVRLNTKNQRCHVVINNSGVRFNEVAIQCLGEGGFYMDVNGTDVNEKMDLRWGHLDNCTNLSIVDLCSLVSSTSEEKKILQNLVAEGIAKGIVRPLSRIVYSAVDTSSAINYVTSKRHFGRTLINMEDYDKTLNTFNIIQRIFLKPEATYVVVCAETDLGIELAGRLVQRGARNLIIHNKFNKGYYYIKQRSWQKLNVTSSLNSENLETKAGCEKLLRVNEKMGPVEGIFVVIDFEPKNTVMKTDYEAVVKTIENLNEVSTNNCDLRYFVLLTHSSKNENDLHKQCTRICLERKQIGHSALFLQVGMIDTYNGYNVQSNRILLKISTVLNALETSIQRKYTGVSCSAGEIKQNGLNNDVHKVQNGVAENGLEFFYKRIEENEINTPELFVNIANKISNSSEIEDIPDPDSAFLLMIPGFDGNLELFKTLCEKLKIQVIGVKLDPNISNNSIEEMATDIMKFVKRCFRLKFKFYFFGYSFGVNVALELAYKFEKEGHVGLVCCLDGSPDFLRVQLQANIGNLSYIQLQNSVICLMYKLIAGREDKELLNALNELDWSAKVDVCINRLKLKVRYAHSYMKFLIDAAFQRVILAKEYEPEFKLQSELVLIKSSTSILAEDYNLSKYCVNPVKVFTINDQAAPSESKIANIVNKLLDPEVIFEFKKKNNNCDTYFYDPYNLE